VTGSLACFVLECRGARKILNKALAQGFSKHRKDLKIIQAPWNTIPKNEINTNKY
jgi:hypothetical protein